MYVFYVFADDCWMIFGHFQSIPSLPSHFRMFPEGSGASQALFGAFRSCRSRKKTNIFKKQCRPTFFFGQKIICWGSSETVFAGFPGHGGLILNGKRSFKVTPPPSEARSERSEVRAKRGSSCCQQQAIRRECTARRELARAESSRAQWCT